MAEVLLYILISVACGLALVGIVSQWILHSRKRKETSTLTEQMHYAVDQTTREMQKFFDILRMKPTTKGVFGENVVAMLLSNLPNKFVKSQYQPIDISGRIDFVIQLPNSDLFIPIDSKFILPNEFENIEEVQMDKLAIDKLNKNSIRRAKEIIKYIQSVETTDFVLMYIPDFVYGVLTDQTFQNLAKMNVIPTNTSGLLSTIFMIKMQYRFTKLNSAASSFGNIQMKVCLGMEEVLEKIKTGTGQLQNSLNNITAAKNELTKLNTMLNTLDIENF